MADIRQSSTLNSKANLLFDAESVAGDLWMRQHYSEIHLELDAGEAATFIGEAETAGLILEAAENGTSSSDVDLAH